jgi:CRISPR-associated protein (TIGR03986 family)
VDLKPMKMNNIKSPYNFVSAPVDSEVFRPDWLKYISHDIPFSDGESGEIVVKITAESPIFIRDGHKKGQETNEFSHLQLPNGKKYFIPASSLKGMVRNVLEILSFSELNKKLVNNNRYAFRDISRSKTEYLDTFKKFSIQAGWLTQDKNDHWYIEPCQKFAFINHEELKTKGFPFRDLFLNNNPIDKTAAYKYREVEEKKLTLKHTFSTYEKHFGNVTRNKCKFDLAGDEGTLVFTGQSSKRNENEKDKKKSSGKFHEFVFFDAAEKRPISVDPAMQSDFKFIYHDTTDNANCSKDWAYWKKKIENGGRAPVFFTQDKDGNLLHFGLTYMYKLPYNHSIHDMTPLADYSGGMDLATGIFGMSDDKTDLKGRVFFGHAFATDPAKIRPMEPDKRIMGGPRASFFPFYLDQSNRHQNNYNTYQNKSSLKGFKRYPVHTSIKHQKVEENRKSEKVYTHFQPLDKGAEFELKLRFHNLKAIEIGALLSALTFHGNQDKCFHSLGAIKSFGFGKIRLEIVTLNHTEHSVNTYMSKFEEAMNEHLPNWYKNPRNLELFQMASNENDYPLEYASLAEYQAYKKELKSLPHFSEFISADTDKAKSFKSILKSTQPQAPLDLQQDKFPDLSAHLNILLKEEYEEFSAENQQLIFERICWIYENHNASAKKLSKAYDWDNNISRWLGNDLTQKLKQQLNIKL